MDNAEAPIDLERLTRPDAEAFRQIAAALGARFAGDAEPAAVAKPTVARIPRIGGADPRAAALLDCVPVPTVVVHGDSVTFLNRAAQFTLGYRSATVLDAAGGLGALFPRGDAAAVPGTMMIATANGATFRARVTMTAVEWGGGRAMLVTLEPRHAVVDGWNGATGDLLLRLLDANPDPVAIVDRSGAVEASNVAFRRLAPGEPPAHLDAGLAPGSLRPVLAAIGHAFCLTDGVAEPPGPVIVDGTTYRVTAGPLPGGHLACIVFHAIEPTAPTAIAAPVAPDPRGAVERAVEDVRRLVDAAAVLVILDGAPRDDGDAPAVRFWRALILAVAARADVGSVLTVRHDAGLTVLRLSPRATLPFERVLASLRIADLAAAAAFEIGIDADALVVRPAGPGGVAVPRLDNLR